jgi:hypothetical protein
MASWLLLAGLKKLNWTEAYGMRKSLASLDHGVSFPEAAAKTALCGNF